MKHKIKIVIIGTYFGKFPSYFDLWLKSASWNKSIDFLIITDQQICAVSSNIKVIRSDLKRIADLAKEKLKFNVRIDFPYKLCDYKEVYGIIFEDYIKDYDYWGECDFDMIWGDLKKFFDLYQIEKYDKFLSCGHLTLYRNTKSVNQRYRLKGSWTGNYKEVFRSKRCCGFDEELGINQIYRLHKFPYFEKIIFADIDTRYRDYRHAKTEDIINYSKQIFYWEDGKVLKDYFDGGNLKTEEFAYIHLQKRQLPSPPSELLNEDTSFYITNKGFIKKEDVTTGGVIDEYNLKIEEDIRFIEAQERLVRQTINLRKTWAGRRVYDMRVILFHTAGIILKKIPGGSSVISILKKQRIKKALKH